MGPLFRTNGPASRSECMVAVKSPTKLTYSAEPSAPPRATALLRSTSSPQEEKATAVPGAHVHVSAGTLTDCQRGETRSNPKLKGDAAEQSPTDARSSRNKRITFLRLKQTHHGAVQSSVQEVDVVKSPQCAKDSQCAAPCKQPPPPRLLRLRAPREQAQQSDSQRCAAAASCMSEGKDSSPEIVQFDEDGAAAPAQPSLIEPDVRQKDARVGELCDQTSSGTGQVDKCGFERSVETSTVVDNKKSTLEADCRAITSMQVVAIEITGQESEMTKMHPFSVNKNTESEVLDSTHVDSTARRIQYSVFANIHPFNSPRQDEDSSFLTPGIRQDKINSLQPPPAVPVSAALKSSSSSSSLSSIFSSAPTHERTTVISPEMQRTSLDEDPEVKLLLTLIDGDGALTTSRSASRAKGAQTTKRPVRRTIV